ncbi:hypothetical protein BpHYR1_029473 [Brachionus plicatilis]|uniref:Uncharacterized protein n=1 Tax=Brachionus plicatilis TaxID=10195 RepID=A0A3M7S252_BRAPC|nr:hypothetical protein BpHYR1_029473 [Brachionus plicatilis]
MSEQSGKQGSKLGLYLAMGVGATAIGFSIAAIPFLTPALRTHALPYVPATTKQIENVFKAVKGYSLEKSLTKKAPSKTNVVRLIDLGSGDGRIVFDAAERGYHATGVELNTMLYLYSKFKTFTAWKNKSGLFRPVFKRADFWKVNMTQYDLIVVFGVQGMMKDLASKLKEEMKPDCLIVSCRFPISSYKSVFRLEDELDGVWIYDKESLDNLVEEEKKSESKPIDEDDDDD